MKQYQKRIISLLMAFIILLGNSLPIHAQTSSTEWYNLEIIENDEYFEDIETPNSTRGRYIGTVITRITEIETRYIAMQVDVHCQEDMIEITTIFYLQKLVDGLWTDVGSVTVSQENTYNFVKTVRTTEAVPAGTYRAKTSTKVTHPSGQFETQIGYSGGIVID